MRVTDHADHQACQDMYRPRSQTDNLSRNAKNNNPTQTNNKTTQTPEAAMEQDKEAAYARNVQAGAGKSQPSDLSLRRRQERAAAGKTSFEMSGHRTLYSSTADLMAIANTESQEILRGIYVRLSFKLWSVRAAGVNSADSKTVKNATRSIEKVMGKVKGKIRGLQKEDEMEKKAEAARKAKQRRLQQEIRRQLAIKRKIRRNKERKDVEDSYLESHGQYTSNSCMDNLPEYIQLQIEMQRSGASGSAASDMSLAATDAAMAIDSSIVSTSAEAAVSSLALDTGGVIVNVAL